MNIYCERERERGRQTDKKSVFMCAIGQANNNNNNNNNQIEIVR